MKQTKIDLSEPFEDVLARLLTLPSTLAEIDEVRFPSADDSELRKSANCVAEGKEALRSLYEAAHGRQVETPIGFLPIAPPVAAFLKKKPYYVVTQDEFFLEAFTRILGNRNTSVSTKKTNNMNNGNDIIVTAPDHAELTSVITVSGKVSELAKWEPGMLENELKRARIVRPEEVPPDVITMNTRAEFLDLETVNAWNLHWSCLLTQK